MNMRSWPKKVLGIGVAAGMLVAGLSSSPAFAAGAFTNISWAVSNNQVGATGVQYTYNFTTASSGTLITSITFTVPAGTAGTPTVVQNVGVGAGTVALASNTLTYTLTAAQTIGAGIPLQLTFGALTNTSTAGANTSVITTLITAVQVDTGTSPSVTFGATNTTVAVNVARSTTFTTDTTAFTLNMDPSLPALATLSKVVTLTISSNAGLGYSLQAKDTNLTAGAYTIPGNSTSMANGAAMTATHFGSNAVLSGGTGGRPALGGTLATAGNYAGYTTAGQNILTATGPTSSTAHSLALTNKVQIDYTTPAGAYTDTLTYTLTPNY
ncbi:MAG: hypothetical protein NVS1B16_08600 [Pseudarthrobacter sp.]